MLRTSLPLRFKVTLGALGVFVALHLGASGAWIVWERSAALKELDRRLGERVHAVGTRIADDAALLADPAALRALREDIAMDSPLQRCVLIVRGEDGTDVARFPSEGPLARAAIPPPLARDVEEARIVDVARADGEIDQIHVVALSFVAEPGGRFWVQLGAPISDAFDPWSALWTMLVGLPIGALAAGAMVWIIAGRLVGPIQRLTTAARSVSPSNLRGRIDIDPTDSEMARLQKELNDALERLERGYRAQGQFLSNVSHELKTPIAVLLSQAQLLRHKRDAEELGLFAENVEEEMRSMARLVESLLLLARVEHGKELVRQEATSLNEVVLESAERASELARNLDVPLVTNLHLAAEGEGEPELLGDPELLRTMVENLLRNALRFTPAGQPVDLRIVCRLGEASIIVRDRGPGIPREHLERIFERFFQVPGEASKGRGTGLGLAIARSVAELHHGRIAVRNVPGGGCEFEVRLPLARGGPAGKPGRPPPAAPARRAAGKPRRGGASGTQPGRAAAG